MKAEDREQFSRYYIDADEFCNDISSCKRCCESKVLEGIITAQVIASNHYVHGLVQVTLCKDCRFFNAFAKSDKGYCDMFKAIRWSDEYCSTARKQEDD